MTKLNEHNRGKHLPRTSTRWEMRIRVPSVICTQTAKKKLPNTSFQADIIGSRDEMSGKYQSHRRLNVNDAHHTTDLVKNDRGTSFRYGGTGSISEVLGKDQSPSRQNTNEDHIQQTRRKLAEVKLYLVLCLEMALLVQLGKAFATNSSLTAK